MTIKPEDRPGTQPDEPAKRIPAWRRREAQRIHVAALDPALAAAGDPEVFPTAYEPDVLLVAPGDKDDDFDGRIDALDRVAHSLGWTVAGEDLEDHPTGDRAHRRSRARSVRARISVAPRMDAATPIERPDAFRLLVEARRQGVRGIGLNHILSIDALGVNPFTGNPFTGNPFTGNPFTGNPFTGNPFTGNPGGMAGYGIPGFGGRQPVEFIGADPKAGAGASGVRPVVAIVDTGCGKHRWFAGDVVIPESDPEYGQVLGLADPSTDPETRPSQGDQIDGVIDVAAGHGTFIAGIVRQACPEARILPVRVSNSDGLILENDLLGALGRLADIVEEGHPIHVVNLSFSFYHESSDASTIDSELYTLLRRLRGKGCTIVCSAGNDATDRPSSPASLHAWDGNEYGLTADGEKDAETDAQGKAVELAPHVVVGALNPSGKSVALFSNVGPWVDVYARGVSVVSSIPPWPVGGIQSDLRADDYGKRRETLDIDDFGSGFAVWSGTSFAAPYVAGSIAKKIAEGSPALAAGPTPAEAVAEALEDFKKKDESGIPPQPLSGTP